MCGTWVGARLGTLLGRAQGLGAARRLRRIRLERLVYVVVQRAHTLPPGTSRFEARLSSSVEGQACLTFSGSLRLAQAGELWEVLRRHIAAAPPDSVLNFDLAQAEAVDGSAMALLVQARAELQRRGVGCELLGASPKVHELVRLYRGDVEVRPAKRRKARSTFEQIGDATVHVFHEAKLALAFIGDLAVELPGVLRAPKTGNLREVPSIMERTGADALPIVLLINFLVGLVMAFQASVQLKRFGANILVADLIGISMTRELGPLMTAIVVSGRSGAAFAAELGTMKVNEEIDALRVLGFSPLRYLVLPRVLGLLLVLPLLALFADVVGIVGGLVVGVTRLDLTLTSYLRQTFHAVKLWDVYSGVIKAGLFAVAIGLIASQQGLAATGGAEGVGQRTTAAVVSSLFTLILIDAIFTVMFRLTGL
jgi:phospholipid/cholesterol/gamma-HCH transport system permease protein